MSDPNSPVNPEQPPQGDGTTPPPAYGAPQPPAYGAPQPPAYGAPQPPDYGQPPAYGQQPPAYGQQPPAYGQQPPAYGQQPPAYGQPAYGQQPPAYGAPPVANPYGGGPAGGYASWGDRIVATLWDLLFVWPGWVTVLVGYAVLFAGIAANSDGSGGGPLFAVGALLIVVGIGLGIWRTVINYMLDQGRTGYTYGKRKVGIRVVREADGQPSGVGSCVGRYFLHGLINQVCYIDYLWPLWDPKVQTLTDKVLSTIVVKQPDQTR